MYKCDDSYVIPNFLNFCLINSHLKCSPTCKLCQSHLLREEIRQKNLQSIKVSLKNELSLVDFAHVSTLFFGINAKSLKLKSLVQPKKFYKLLQESKTEKNPQKIVFNLFKYTLSDIEKNLLSEGLNICLPSKPLKYDYCLVHFELLYRDIHNLEILSH